MTEFEVEKSAVKSQRSVKLDLFLCSYRNLRLKVQEVLGANGLVNQPVIPKNTTFVCYNPPVKALHIA